MHVVTVLTKRIVYNRHQIDHNVKVLTQVRSQLHMLQDLKVRVTLVWITGHGNIHYNDLADQRAKDAVKDADDIPLSELTLTASKEIIKKKYQQSWQRHKI